VTSTHFRINLRTKKLKSLFVGLLGQVVIRSRGLYLQRVIQTQKKCRYAYIP
jgi:hypothetical protein